MFFTGMDRDATGLGRDFDVINGRAYMGNVPTPRTTVGDRVRLRVLALGTEFHMVHLHGHRWQTPAGPEDSSLLGPSGSLTIDFVEDEPGTWMFHCHVAEHMENGMMGDYVALPRGQAQGDRAPAPMEM
ncbi:MAG TPA: multicopper oxidase domain-containing protein [Chloroflexota bacterium]|nr:multicopper oxidase domain-containing protein [Chloroflexota bacterium]